MSGHPSSPTELELLHPALAYHMVNTLGWTRLRPLQAQALPPIIAGHDVLLLAPTAGGKTEAAVFPLLSRIVANDWSGLTVLYVCPIKALLNNLLPRLEQYAGWLGRRVGLWHGDTPASVRARLVADPPDILLTTPESIETMLVSRRVDARWHFARIRAVVVDELHAFAGDDRGWHLLAVLERVSRLAGRSIQRVGLSATIGNPADLLRWLQGPDADRRAGVLVTIAAQTSPPTGGTAPVPDAPPSPGAEVELDYVGSLSNAATVIAELHAGEKRLVFADSRLAVERLAIELRARGVTAYVSHSSLSLDERRQAERAFAEARNCVIVATSTLELGIDVGDLDRVIQIGAPRTVASFLQRLGRTGRRRGSARNALFLAPTDDALLHAAGLLREWARGYVEPIEPPPAPLHIGAQQLIALVLQESSVGWHDWRAWWGDLPIFGADNLAGWLVDKDLLALNEGMLSVGTNTEHRYGRRHFMELLSVITGSPEFTVLHGRTHIGAVDLAALLSPCDGPRVLLLGGRAWRITHTDWRRRRCYTEPTTLAGNTSWSSPPRYLSGRLCQAQREILLGADPAVRLTRRASRRLTELRDERGDRVAPDATIVTRSASGLTWWTFAGGRANVTLVAAVGGAADPERVDDHRIRLRDDLTPDDLHRLRLDALAKDLPAPRVTEKAVRGLKFADILPIRVAADTLAARLADPEGARHALTLPVRWSRRSSTDS